MRDSVHASLRRFDAAAAVLPAADDHLRPLGGSLAVLSARDHWLPTVPQLANCLGCVAAGPVLGLLSDRWRLDWHAARPASIGIMA